MDAWMHSNSTTKPLDQDWACSRPGIQFENWKKTHFRMELKTPGFEPSPQDHC